MLRVPVLVSRGDVLDELERYFEIHPEITARRHHARVDAEALRSAFMEVIG
jgi:DNA polymerase III epsilon subunit-like protein